MSYIIHRKIEEFNFSLGKHTIIIMTINGAGSFFTNGTHVLAGYQPYKEKPIISGIGGKCLLGELPFKTVIRETIEELFVIDDLDDKVTAELCQILPQNIILHNNYYIHVYSFTDLEIMLDILRRNRIVSPVYDRLPINIYEIIINRKMMPYEKYAEISHLSLLPLISYDVDSGIIDRYFIQDINYYLSLMSKTHEALCQKLDHAIL